MARHDPAYLTVFRKGERPLMFELAREDGFVVIGRVDECEITVQDRRVSREHAEVEVAEGQYRLRDLESSNGTLLNGEKLLGSRRLEHGDKIVIGGYLLRFERKSRRDREKPQTREEPRRLRSGRRKRIKDSVTPAVKDGVNELNLDQLGIDLEEEEKPPEKSPGKPEKKPPAPAAAREESKPQKPPEQEPAAKVDSGEISDLDLDAFEYE